MVTSTPQTPNRKDERKDGLRVYALPPLPDVAAWHADQTAHEASGRYDCGAMSQTLSDIGIRDKLVQWWLLVLLGRLIFPVNEREQWCVMPYLKTSEQTDNLALAAMLEPLQLLVGKSEVAYVASGANFFALETLMHARVSLCCFETQICQWSREIGNLWFVARRSTSTTQIEQERVPSRVAAT